MKAKDFINIAGLAGILLTGASLYAQSTVGDTAWYLWKGNRAWRY
ncbi:hypothetical protein [Chitinophaga pinensis]|nr:hypothetical protein [Chitinophaga pinensis]